MFNYLDMQHAYQWHHVCMKLPRAIGLTIQDNRTKKKMDQIELAAHADTQRSYVSTIENGKTNISMDVFIRLCDGLEKNPRDILDETLKRMGR